jgi:hypothetical protein
MTGISHSDAVKCAYLPCRLDLYTYIPRYKTLKLLFTSGVIGCLLTNIN